jgi:hypothetical protein
MNFSPLTYLRGTLAGLAAALVLGCGLNLARPTESRPASIESPRLIVDGQETHGGGKGGRRVMFRIADSGQETHGGKGGRRCAC